MESNDRLTGDSISESKDETTNEHWRRVNKEDGAYLDEYTRPCEDQSVGQVCKDVKRGNYTEGTELVEYYVDDVHVRDVERNADGTENERKFRDESGNEIDETVMKDEYDREIT